MLLQCPYIKFLFGYPVRVQWLQLRNVGFIIFITQCSVAIGSRRRGIYHWNAIFGTVLPDILRIADIQLLKNLYIKLGSICTRTEVKYEIDSARMLFQPVEELLPVYFGHVFFIQQIIGLGLCRKIVYQYQLLIAQLIKVTSKHTGDKTGGSCYNNRGIFRYHTHFIWLKKVKQLLNLFLILIFCISVLLLLHDAQQPLRGACCL
ncbi:hypothetical protein D3C86_1433080 [compost metagenome]